MVKIQLCNMTMNETDNLWSHKHFENNWKFPPKNQTRVEKLPDCSRIPSSSIFTPLTVCRIPPSILIAIPKSQSRKKKVSISFFPRNFRSRPVYIRKGSRWRCGAIAETNCFTVEWASFVAVGERKVYATDLLPCRRYHRTTTRQVWAGRQKFKFSGFLMAAHVPALGGR